MPDGTPISTIRGYGLKDRKADYETVANFIDNPPADFRVFYGPVAMRRQQVTRERQMMVVATGLTGLDYQWDPFDGEMVHPPKFRDSGILIRKQAEDSSGGGLGIDVRFYNLSQPTDLSTPMDRLSVLPSGEVLGAGRVGFYKKEEDETRVGRVIGVVAWAIREDRLAVPELYWMQKIEGMGYPEGESPFVTR